MTPTPDIPALLAEVARLDKLATKGPWKAGLTQYSRSRPHFLAPVSNPERTIANTCDGPRKADQLSNDADFIALSRHGMPALAAEVERLREKNAGLKAWQDEIRGAIDRSGMGIMRTSQGPSGTMLGYRPEVDEEHQRKTLEVIHENADLQLEVRRLKEQLSALSTLTSPKPSQP